MKTVIGDDDWCESCNYLEPVAGYWDDDGEGGRPLCGDCLVKLLTGWDADGDTSNAT
jgi:hypothetical protein